jgi:hypothetical protein
MYWVLGTGKLISNSGFFLCLLLSAERQAHGPLVISQEIWISYNFLQKFLPVQCMVLVQTIP